MNTCSNMNLRNQLIKSVGSSLKINRLVRNLTIDSLDGLVFDLTLDVINGDEINGWMWELIYDKLRKYEFNNQNNIIAKDFS